MVPINAFARLRVVALDRVGAFLSWEPTKDLLLPMEEQTREVLVGEELLVYVYVDFSGRPAASMRLEAFIDPNPAGLYPQKKVSLWIIGESDLGFTAIIDGKQLGILYRSEVFQKIGYASQVVGYVKKVREDGKVDLILQPAGIKGRADVGRQILDKLTESGGFLALTEKSTPALIYELFGVSKKQFKMALGGIYKQHLVSLDADGIRLQR